VPPRDPIDILTDLFAEIRGSGIPIRVAQAMDEAIVILRSMAARIEDLEKRLRETDPEIPAAPPVPSLNEMVFRNDTNEL
jgi:hypothetical protein